MKLPTIRLRDQARRAEAMFDCGASVSSHTRDWNLLATDLETLNRCWPVTDKRKSAWQKRAVVAMNAV
jgi:hypothetical protein